MAPSHYLNQCWNIVNCTIGNTLQRNLNQNWYPFIQENAFEPVVCEMAAIFLSASMCELRWKWDRNGLIRFNTRNWWPLGVEIDTIVYMKTIRSEQNGHHFVPLLLRQLRVASPGLQQSWYWLCIINVSFSTMNDISYLRNLNVQKWNNCKHLFALNKFNWAWQVLIIMTFLKIVCFWNFSRFSQGIMSVSKCLSSANGKHGSDLRSGIRNHWRSKTFPTNCEFRVS